MTKIENPSREHILSRIREALRAPAPPVDMTPVPLEEIFEPVADPLGRFLAECQTNLMEAVVTANTAESAERLAGLLTALPEGEIFLQDAPAIREIAKPLEGRSSLRWSSQGAPGESCQATVTLAEAFGGAIRFGALLVQLRRPRRFGHAAYAYRLWRCQPDRPRCHGGPAPGQREGPAGPKLLRRPHQRLKPNGRHREDSGAGRTRTATAGGNPAARVKRAAGLRRKDHFTRHRMGTP
jgi:hypothetical protein